MSDSKHDPAQRFWKRHPYASCALASLACGVAIALYFVIRMGSASPTNWIIELLVYSFGCGWFIGLPAVLIAIHTAELAAGARTLRDRRVSNTFDIVTILAILNHGALYLMIGNVVPTADWDVQLINAQLHTPISTATWPTMAVLTCVAIAAYFALTYAPLEKAGPLAPVCAMAGVYIGIALAVIWSVQVAWTPFMPIGVALALIGAKAVRNAAIKFVEMAPAPSPDSEGPFRHRPAWIAKCEAVLARAQRWPAAAAAIMWPILGVVVCILMLFGQEPSAVVTGWLNTSDWTLSTQTSPPNLIVDEHYLCTAAANGHRKVVRPLRRGVRHGHEVVVNRQLCVANAFEDLLKERAPQAHARIRGFYDAYGLPVARLIRSKWAADVTYLVMKPLEWAFLAALYLFDPTPEDRIAVQYAPKRHEPNLR